MATVFAAARNFWHSTGFRETDGTTMTGENCNSRKAAAIEAKAAIWLAKRDRGLTPAEQDMYLQWLRDDERHRVALLRLERTWSTLDLMTEWRPQHSPKPNPDLLANRRRIGWSWTAGIGALAAAAVLTTGIFILRDRSDAPAGVAPMSVAAINVAPGPERLNLPDGSMVEINRGGRIETRFTASERRVRLVSGEAHFIIAKDSTRPFVVDAGAVAVRAVGTAFDVRRGSASVEVLVTEGRVQLERTRRAGEEADEPTALGAGDFATVDLTTPAAAPRVISLSRGEIERALAWQGAKLEFADQPLQEVVAQFNLRNGQRLVIGDPELSGVLVGGSFRADNVEAFVRLLELSFGMSAERRDGGVIVLRRAK